MVKKLIRGTDRDYPRTYDALFRVYSRSGERIFSRGWSPAVTGGRGRERAGEGGRVPGESRRGPIGVRRGRNGPFSAHFGAKIPRIGGEDAIFRRSTRARALQQRSAFRDPAEAAFFDGIFYVSDFLEVICAFYDPRLNRARRRGAYTSWRDVPRPFRGQKRSRTDRKWAVNAMRHFFPP